MGEVKLTLRSNSGEITLTPYLDVEAGKGMEPGDPRFTEKMFARSLLKQGATYALENLHEKELIYPVKLKAATKTALLELVEEINTILNTAGAQVEWQEEGSNKPTYFDLIS